MKSVVGSLIGIIVCGGIGGIVAWQFVGWIGLDGTAGAFVAAAVGMVVAVAVFTVATSLLRVLGWAR